VEVEVEEIEGVVGDGAGGGSSGGHQWVVGEFGGGGRVRWR